MVAQISTFGHLDFLTVSARAKRVRQLEVHMMPPFGIMVHAEDCDALPFKWCFSGLPA